MARSDEFVQEIKQQLEDGKKHTKPTVEKLARSFGIQDKTLAKEFTELALVQLSRDIAHRSEPLRTRYEAIVKLYKLQPVLSQRTSTSLLLQQFSTPAPITFLAGMFVGIDNTGSYFEPSAGNGMMTIAGDPKDFTVNEIDNTRANNLRSQGFRNVSQVDASQSFDETLDYFRVFGGVLTNPPFGRLDNAVKFETEPDEETGKVLSFPITTLEHLMSIRALETMINKGKAALIIGGHTKWDARGRIQAGKNRIFMNFLYRFYHVEEVVNMDGSLYARMGTSFPTRLILIDGRKLEPGGAAPLRTKQDRIVKNFDQLFDRVAPHITESSETDLEAEALALEVELDLSGFGKSENDRRTEQSQSKFSQSKVDYRPSEMTGAYCGKCRYFKRADNTCELVQGTINAEWTCNLFQSISSDPNFTVAQRNDILKASRVPASIGASQLDRNNNNQVLLGASELERMNELVLLGRIGASEIDSMTYQVLLGKPYVPSAKACFILNTEAPDAMWFETEFALKVITKAVGGDMQNFVRDRLGYETTRDLCDALAAEQVDAVGMAIYNIEAKGQALIIGDQTGIGKGRQGAALIRYGGQQGIKPIYLTEKPNLFSDLYRDLADIGSAHLVPFIVNSRESKTHIKDREGKIVYQALAKPEQERIFQSKKVPDGFDYVVATYSQFNQPTEKPLKPQFLLSIAKDNIMGMDESHNASGSSNTGEFLQSVLTKTIGALFLSATFAKRPDNMPIYAAKTAISEANMTRDELIEAIVKGGVALQEILAAQLVKEGQMIRRERTFEGIEVNYITLTQLSEKHRELADRVTEILRDIIEFQKKDITPVVKQLDKTAAAEGKEVELRKGTSKAGVDNQPYFSKVFNVINQMLFAIKAPEVAQKAIERLKQGKKPVIAFASTMGIFLEEMTTVNGLPIAPGEVVRADFSEVLQKGLDGVLRYTEKDETGESVPMKFSLDELGPEARDTYNKIASKISNVAIGITISPIDLIRQTIEKAGFTVAEVTGRKLELQLDLKSDTGIVLSRKKLNTNDAFRMFNDNEADVLMINQSGSTGASAHAISTSKVLPDQVKQRVMIILQPELDINREVQKRGRINRTGQLLKPIYDYVISDIPAEQRLMMMLQKKLKSLDANTSSNQKQSESILKVDDFLNKFGDKVVTEYMLENPELNEMLDDPLKLKDRKAGDDVVAENASHKVSGRVAVLSTKMQDQFYTDVLERYSDLVDLLKQTGEFDLEVEAMDLQAKTIDVQVIKAGKGGASEFGSDTMLETVEAKILKKAFTQDEVEKLIKDELKGRSPLEITNTLEQKAKEFFSTKLADEIIKINARYDDLVKKIPNEKAILKIVDIGQREDATLVRERELDRAREEALGRAEDSSKNREDYILGLLNFFYPGRAIDYPFTQFGQGQIKVKGVFIGYDIKDTRSNPYAPSAIKLKFALASGIRYIALPASRNLDITAIMGASHGLTAEGEVSSRISEWNELIKASEKPFEIRSIITGNILQAFSNFTGKLVSYTTNKGDIKKGILMPEGWDSGREVGEKIIVPVGRALNIIKSMTSDSVLSIDSIAIAKRFDGDYVMILPASRKRGGQFFLDENLLKLIVGNNFEKIGDQMRGTILETNITKTVELLQSQFNLSVSIDASRFDQLLPPQSSKVKAIKPPGKPKPAAKQKKGALELEAEALELELQLLEL